MQKSGARKYSHILKFNLVSDSWVTRSDEVCLKLSKNLMALLFTWECTTPPRVHPMSIHVTAHDKFYQAFPTLSDKCWGEKAWE